MAAMAQDRIFGIDSPIAQLMLSGGCLATIEAWFSEDGVRFTGAEAGLGGLPDAGTPIGGGPLVIQLSRESLMIDAARTIALLGDLAARVPIIAILDAELVDVLPPFLDVDPVEYVAWPCGKETFMSVLQQIGSPSLRECAESRPINPELLRDEVERIAKALSALVDDSRSHAQPLRPTSRSPAESARLIRTIIRRRRARAQFFPSELFADPAWDILLDLAAARLESTRVSISSLCIAASVPTTTALRWIKGMTSAGILEREADPEDGRRSFVRLSERAANAMENYLTIIDESVV